MELKIERLARTYPNGVHDLRDVSLTVLPGMSGLLNAVACIHIELT